MLLKHVKNGKHYNSYNIPGLQVLKYIYKHCKWIAINAGEELIPSNNRNCLTAKTQRSAKTYPFHRKFF
jgi:hypothetical protein